MLHAFSAWRDHLTTLEQIGAFRTAQHNFVAPNAPPEPIKVAEITASAFEVAQTPQLLGRYLLGSDEPLRTSLQLAVTDHHRLSQTLLAIGG